MKYKFFIHFIFLVFLLMITVTTAQTNKKDIRVADSNTSMTNRDYWPTHSWKSTSPESIGVDPKQLNDMDLFIKNSLSHIRCVIIVKNGYIIFEKYYPLYGGNYDNTDLFLTASVTKTFTSALIGISIKEGYLKNIYQKAYKFFPEFINNKTNFMIKEITIKNLLTMTSGLSWKDSDFRKPEVNSNPIKYAFSLNIADKPGTTYNYNTLNSQILSRIITKATKMTELEFADKYLFKPLGIKDRAWESDVQGFNYGGMGLKLRTQDMAKFGYLLLNNGVWDGKQIIPADWVANMTKKHNNGGMPENEGYGLHCWVTTIKNHHAYFAAGFGGQFIYVIPDLDTVVAISSFTHVPHLENRDIIAKYIVPSMEK